MQKAVAPILFILLSCTATSQQLNNLRSKYIAELSDTIQIDSLTMVPNSELVFDEKKVIVPDSLYSIDYASSSMVFSGELLNSIDHISISYRVFPINFSKVYFKQKKEEFYNSGPVLTFPAVDYRNSNKNFFTDNQLDKSGSISRGITIGNSQDAVINSNLNLQISGKLSNEMYILAAISDENIPIQPDGNSQQIQDFDKVFIQLYNDRSKLIAGDFEISKPQGYFMNINKKAQGGLLNSRFKGRKNKLSSFETTVSGSVTKGKYCRKTFHGQEGNQGPYRLTGCENEQYIVVLAGTERVYIDGKLQSRGKDHDYTIDYNTGEVIFTANRMITKDLRMAIEFEYSERSYARFLVYSANELKTEKGSFWINIYSEQDSKNQSINQDLSEEQKRTLSESGDNITNALVPNVDSVGFRNDYVLYARKDTFLNSVSYEIYEYSTNPVEAIYQVGFSFVGENKGDYVQIQNSANGKVFEWIAPISGVLQGSYMPVRLLIAPKKQQMVSVGGDVKIGQTAYSNFEFALSNYDLNTFSDKDASDNVGYAVNFAFGKSILNSDTLLHQLKSTISYQLVNKNFTSIERFRDVEFERDWNLEKPFDTDEHFAELDIGYKYKKFIHSNYNFGLLSGGNNFSGYRNGLNVSANKRTFEAGFRSSLLSTRSDLNNTRFLRYLASISKTYKKLKVGFENEMEQNVWSDNGTDSLLKNSFNFLSYRFYAKNLDSAINKYLLSYVLRDDYLPLNNHLNHATRAENFQVGFGLLKNPSNILRTNFTYRQLNVIDTALSEENKENNIAGRIEYSFNLFKGAISSSSFYEAGSGLEPKREYSFIKVPAGQGVYTWIDYNSNGIAELNEFEIAQFRDEANYIRIYSPGNEFVKVYKNEFSQIFNLRPESVWRNITGIRKVLSVFSNSLAFQISQKTTDEILEHSLNPFFSSIDSTLINLNRSVRNTFSFNRLNAKLGADYIFRQNLNKVLLSNGFDQRKRSQHGIKLRWKFFTDFTLRNYFQTGNKLYESEFFSSKDYNIKDISNEIKIQFQPGFQTKLELNYTYADKNNTLSVEEVKIHDIGTEINYSITKRGNLLAKGNYLNIKYNADINSSVAYEMLQGLKPGNNATWNLIFNRKLVGNLELNLLYNGRVSENSDVIHTGSLQVRAFF